MKKLFLFLLLLLTGCAGMQKAPQEQSMSINKVIEVPGVSQEQIFNKTHDWAVKYVQLENADRNSGVLVARGEVAYPSPSVDRIQYTFVFTMRNEIQDNKAMVTFDKIMLKAPLSYLPESVGVSKPYIGGEERPVVAKKDMEAAQYAIGYIEDNLQSYLQTTR